MSVDYDPRRRVLPFSRSKLLPEGVSGALPTAPAKVLFVPRLPPDAGILAGGGPPGPSVPAQGPADRREPLGEAPGEVPQAHILRVLEGRDRAPQEGRDAVQRLGPQPRDRLGPFEISQDLERSAPSAFRW